MQTRIFSLLIRKSSTPVYLGLFLAPVSLVHFNDKKERKRHITYQQLQLRVVTELRSTMIFGPTVGQPSTESQVAREEWLDAEAAGWTDWENCFTAWMVW